MESFSTVYGLLSDISQVCAGFMMSQFRLPSQIDLNVGDWEEIRAYYPGLHIGSKCLFSVPVQTWSGLGHGEFRLRVDGEVVYAA